MKTLNDLPRITVQDYKGLLEPTTERVTFTATNSRGIEVAGESLILKTPCNYGGFRYWLKCNDCQERAMILYLNDDCYQCSKCTGLPYQSQAQKKKERLLNRVKAIRKKLNWSENIEDGHGPKPRGIWYSTYYRLVTEHDNLLTVIA